MMLLPSGSVSSDQNPWAGVAVASARRSAKALGNEKWVSRRDSSPLGVTGTSQCTSGTHGSSGRRRHTYSSRSRGNYPPASMRLRDFRYPPESNRTQTIQPVRLSSKCRRASWRRGSAAARGGVHGDLLVESGRQMIVGSHSWHVSHIHSLEISLAFDAV